MTAANDFSPWFWKIIKEADGNEDKLQKVLEEMSRGDMIQFYREFLLAATELRCPPYLDFLGEVSEDTIEDVTEYVVSQGKRYYSKVLLHPETIPSQEEWRNKRSDMNAPSFKGLASRVFWERFREPILSCLD